MALVPRENPVLAAFLSLLVVGLGHLYLRRWIRGVGWAVVAIATGVAFVPAETRLALAAGESVAPELIAPVLVIVTIAAADAVVVAVRSEADDDGETTCPECGESVDPELAFCQWCTADLSDDD